MYVHISLVRGAGGRAAGEKRHCLEVTVGGALNALKFQCAQRDSLSELFLSENMPCNQCKGKPLRDSEKL